MFAALAAGFLAVMLFAPDPNRQLLQDLPVLENLDEYRQIGDIEFLRMLRDQGLFAKESGELPDPVTAEPESLARRRQRIESMGPSKQEQLLRIEERFTELDRDQQQQLRTLHQAIQQSADATING